MFRHPAGPKICWAGVLGSAVLRLPWSLMSFLNLSEDVLSSGRTTIGSGCAICLLFVATAAWGQMVQPPGGLRNGSDVAAPTKKAIRASLYDVTARAAEVSLRDRRLTIEANNSDLAQILRDVAAKSGMAIDGLGADRTEDDARVFGVYGPGNPSDVLTELLAASGYNFAMVGNTPDGAPRQLLLSPRSNNPPASAPVNPAPAVADREQDSQDPGSLVNQPDVDSQEHALQRLQHIHEQQQQQNGSH